MYVFGNNKKARGCFTKFDLNTSLGQGARLVLPVGGPFPATNAGVEDPMVVTGISFTAKEKFHVIQCFNGITHTYAFGTDPLSSMISIIYTGFLIASNGYGTSSVTQQFLDMYESNRLSKSLKGAAVTIGRSILNGYIVGIHSATIDPHHNLQSFEINLLMIRANFDASGIA